MVCRDKENFFGRGWRRHKIHAEMHWALFPQNLTKTAYKLEECQLLDSGVLCYTETMLQYGYWGSNRAGPTQLWSHSKVCSAFLQGRLSRMMDSSPNISHSNTCIISFYCEHLLLLKLSKRKTTHTAALPYCCLCYNITKWKIRLYSNPDISTCQYFYMGEKLWQTLI